MKTLITLFTCFLGDLVGKAHRTEKKIIIKTLLLSSFRHWFVYFHIHLIHVSVFLPASPSAWVTHTHTCKSIHLSHFCRTQPYDTNPDCQIKSYPLSIRHPLSQVLAGKLRMFLRTTSFTQNLGKYSPQKCE